VGRWAVTHCLSQGYKQWTGGLSLIVSARDINSGQVGCHSLSQPGI